MEQTVDCCETTSSEEELLHCVSGTKMPVPVVKKEEVKEDDESTTFTYLTDYREKKRKGEDVSSPSKVKKESESEVVTVNVEDLSISMKVLDSINTNCSSPTKVKLLLEDDEVVDVSNPRDSSETGSSVGSTLKKKNESCTKIKLPLEDDDEVVDVSNPRDNLETGSLVGSILKINKSCTKIKLPLEDDDMVLTTNRTDGLPWWYSFATDINDDIMSILKK